MTETTKAATVDDVVQTISGESVCGFKVAAWQYLGPNDDAKYGHRYCEHWSTVGNHPKKVVRLFTEDQLRAALSTPPTAELTNEATAGTLDAKIKAVHVDLGGNGWAYSNYDNDELNTHRDQLEAVVRACCDPAPVEEPEPAPITYEPCGGCGATSPMERCFGCFHNFYPNNA